MPLVIPLVPGQRTTPEAVVIEEVRRNAVVVALLAIRVLTTKRCSRRLRRVLVVGLKFSGVAKGFELVVVDHTHARDPVTPVAAPVCGSCNKV